MSLAQPDPQEWFEEITATVRGAHLASLALLAIDAKSGRILAGTPTAEAVLGVAIPDHLDDLVAAGVLAAADVERLRSQAASWPEATTVPEREQARTWHTDLLVRRGDIDHLVAATVAQHRRPVRQRELLLLTLDEVATKGADAQTSPVVPVELWSALDREARIVALEPGFSRLWPEPERLVGTLISPLVHPEDMAELLPLAHELYGGRLDTADYTVRVAAADGSWVTLHVAARVLRGDDLLVINRNRIVDASRSVIDPGVLSRREASVVDALFDGLRVAQVAERDHVSVHTVRNQLKSIYRKLDVTGQADLLARYHRPPAG